MSNIQQFSMIGHSVVSLPWAGLISKSWIAHFSRIDSPLSSSTFEGNCSKMSYPLVMQVWLQTVVSRFSPAFARKNNHPLLPWIRLSGVSSSREWLAANCIYPALQQDRLQNFLSPISAGLTILDSIPHFSRIGHKVSSSVLQQDWLPRFLSHTSASLSPISLIRQFSRNGSKVS